MSGTYSRSDSSTMKVLDAQACVFIKVTKGCCSMRKMLPRLLACCWLYMLFHYPAFSAAPDDEGSPQRTSQIALVIDDFGNAMGGTNEMLHLPVPFTAAVMPFMPTTKADAIAAHRLGHDVIIHMPMEPNRGKRSWLGPGAITTDLSDEEIRKRVEDAVRDVPHAIGMNNHMGSRATADRRVMRIVLEVCKEHRLFFLDSRTTGESVIPALGEELGVPVIERNGVFLDEVYSYAHIAKQLVRLDEQLDTQSASIAIGHVGPPGKKTAAALQEAIPRLQRKAVFLRLSDMFPALLRYESILPNAVSDRGRDALLPSRVGQSGPIFGAADEAKLDNNGRPTHIVQ